MNMTTRTGDILDDKRDLAVFGVFAGTQNFTGSLRQADKKLGGLIAELIADEDFGGKRGEIVALHTHGKLGANRVAVIGLGEKKGFGAEGLRRFAGSIIGYAQRVGVRDIICEVPASGLPAQAAAQAMTEGALLSEYEFLSFRPTEDRKRKKQPLGDFALLAADNAQARAGEKGIALGEVMSRATIYARDLVNEPPARTTPMHLREHAERIAEASGNIRLKVLDREACAKLGMGCFLAVAAGSDEAPYFLHLTYSSKNSKSQKPNSKKVALIGKGVTFDSGGLSLKPTSAMETMKCDMAGAAAVLGVFSVLDDLEPDAEIHGLIAACENMPSGKAMRVGDIVTAMNGKSVEILNTDAEGRLTLADALSYAEKKIKPDTAVDLATLTGACVVALGPDIAGLFSDDDKLASHLDRSAAAEGEGLWRLPIVDDYAHFIKGDHSDLRNTGRVRWGDSISAALFLKEFAGSMSWAHLDIAGPAFAEREMNSYTKKGGTGFGVRLLLDWLKGI